MESHPIMEDCAICLDILDKPFQLPCSHTFCTACLKQIFLSNQEKNNIAFYCPMCRSAVHDENALCHQWYSFENAPTAEILETLNSNDHAYPRYVDGDENEKHELFRGPMADQACRNLMKAIENKNHKVLIWWSNHIRMDGEAATELIDKAVAKNDLTSVQWLLMTLSESAYDDIVRKVTSSLTDPETDAFLEMSLEMYEFWYTKTVIIFTEHEISETLYKIQDTRKLDWWKDRLPVYHVKGVFGTDVLDVLEWWRANAYSSYLKLDIEYIVDNAPNAATLQWWKKVLEEDGIEFKYTEEAVIGAIKDDDFERLKWWKDSGFPIKCFLREATQFVTSLDVLKWITANLVGHKMTLSYSLPSVLLRCCQSFAPNDEYCSRYGIKTSDRMRIMNYCVRLFNIPSRAVVYDHVATVCIEALCRAGQISILQWWKDEGLPFHNRHTAMDLASKYGHIAVLDWFCEQNFPIRYSQAAMDCALRSENYEVVEWWRDKQNTQNLPLRMSYPNTRMDDTWENDDDDYHLNDFISLLGRRNIEEEEEEEEEFEWGSTEGSEDEIVESYATTCTKIATVQQEILSNAICLAE